MKKPKPGQTYWLHGHQLRFKKRECGCKGCLYEDNIMLCPGVEIKGVKALDCIGYGIILVNFK